MFNKPLNVDILKVSGVHCSVILCSIVEKVLEQHENFENVHFQVNYLFY